MPENEFFAASDLESLELRPGEVQVRFRDVARPIVYRPGAEGLPWSPEALEVAWDHFARRAGLSPENDDAFADFVEAVEELAEEALASAEDDAVEA